MKILITGYSGSGKSTLSRKLQERYSGSLLSTLMPFSFYRLGRPAPRRSSNAPSRPSSTSIVTAG